MRKTTIAVLSLAFALGLAAGLRSARAYPGQYCLDSSTCGRCEICVPDQPNMPAGKCVKLAGCR